MLNYSTVPLRLFLKAFNINDFVLIVEFLNIRLNFQQSFGKHYKQWLSEEVEFRKNKG